MFQDRTVKGADGKEKPCSFPNIEAEADYCDVSRDYERVEKVLTNRRNEWGEEWRELPVSRYGRHRPRTWRELILYQLRLSRRPKPTPVRVELLRGRNLAELPKRVIAQGTRGGASPEAPTSVRGWLEDLAGGVSREYRRNVESYEAVFQILYRGGGSQPYEYCHKHRQHETGQRGGWAYCPWMDTGKFEYSEGRISKFLEELEARQQWRGMEGRIRRKMEHLEEFHRERTKDALSKILG